MAILYACDNPACEECGAIVEFLCAAPRYPECRCGEYLKPLEPEPADFRAARQDVA